MKVWFPFGLLLHWGSPKHPTEIRAHTGLRLKSGPQSDQFTTHQVGRWYGISYQHNWFCGFCLFSESREYRSPPDKSPRKQGAEG